MKNTTTVRDLRSALALLKTLPGEYVETDTEVTRMRSCPAYTVTLGPAAPASAQLAKMAR